MANETSEERRRVQHPVGQGISKTRQADKDSCDINIIVDRLLKKGIVPRMAGGVAKYGDFSSGLDFKETLDRIMEAEDQFMELPAKVREACDNDPGRFLDLVADPEKREELEKLGMTPDRDPAGEPVADPASPDPDPAPGQPEG